MQNSGNAKYIVFEGTSGCGKTTIATAIYNDLPGEPDADKILTREPGSPHSEFCVKLRELILHGRNQDIDPMTYAYLFAADTYEHLNKIVLPALLEDKWVVSTRSVISDFAYRPDTGGSVRIHNYHKFLALNPKLFWIDTEPEVCQSRVENRETPLNELEKIREAYQENLVEDRRVPAGDYRAWYRVPNNRDLQSAVEAVKGHLMKHFEGLESLPSFR